MSIAITVDHPAPGYRDEFLAFMRNVIDAVEGAPGLIEFIVCVNRMTRSSWV
jgi:quinol monooxygenase YgiN